MPVNNHRLAAGFWLAGLCLSSLPGCGVDPVRETLDMTLPSQWTSEPSTQPAIGNWLQTFSDPDLEVLLQETWHNNYDLKAAAARVQAAQELVKIEGSVRLPQLAFAPGYQRGKEPASDQAGHFNALFGFSWELDVWGRIQAAQQSAQQQANATAADYQYARLSLSARTAQTYFELAEARLQTEVAEQSVHDRGVIVALIRGRFNKGLTRGLDLRLALTDLANAEAQLANARNQTQVFARRLDVLLGRYPSAGLIDKAHFAELPPPIAAGLPAELLNRRPDIVAAFERLRAADSRLESAHKALLPRITLTANGGTGSPALTELIDPRAAAWNVAMGLVQPLFTGDRLQAQIRLNQAEVDAAINAYKSTALNAFREVEQALAAETWLRTEEKALRQAVEQTRASRKLAVYSYQQGLIEILTLLDSYRSTLNAQSAHLVVQRQLLTNRINLYLALGGAV
ncbi:MAG: efflux transporter outer membrane subunit [Methylomonas sp.]|jgi:NodT family efflux transporter outer membrane factor (OMF) lipoprotein|uniref:efflux transporter outer membrane subunit n=1 Tax=Methylomonas sp. TaxID=418 RepID=UPI0025EA8037|nr:efflux transporter outer membrane subunit [Methylomonas sp.]MCK9608475.1 efflux transporter outer membrane subunit [Methylomonas sp.]